VQVFFFVIGPGAIHVLPRCMAGAMLIHMGLELVREAVVEPFSGLDRLEYIAVCAIALVMTFAGERRSEAGGGGRVEGGGWHGRMQVPGYRATGHGTGWGDRACRAAPLSLLQAGISPRRPGPRGWQLWPWRTAIPHTPLTQPSPTHALFLPLLARPPIHHHPPVFQA
jgi:hypothetical protein